MNKLIILSIAVFSLVMTTDASAQLGSLLGKSMGLPASGQAGGSYQSNNQIRTFVTSGPHDNIDLYGRAIVKAGEMTKAKGFTNFGVTKYNCSQTLMRGIPVAKGCYIIAVMLVDGMEAKPRGSRKVHYYRVDDVLEGRIMRPQE